MTRHQVLQLRPWETSGGAGGGCCSSASVQGLCLDPAHDPAAHGSRAAGQPLARTYLALRYGLPDDVDVQIVDPRNHVYLLPVLMRAARRRGLGWWAALGEALRAPGDAALIVDGVPVSSGELLAPAEALRLVRQSLGLQPSA